MRLSQRGAGCGSVVESVIHAQSDRTEEASGGGVAGGTDVGFPEPSIVPPVPNNTGPIPVTVP